jgi:cell wall-associated NlpC family hydrolase
MGSVDLAEGMVTAARSFLGVRFRHRGRTNRGIDCAGLVILARNAALGTEDDFHDYPRIPTETSVTEILLPYAEKIKRSEARSGDVAQMQWNGRAIHLGILTGAGTVIHASAEADAVIERPISVRGNGRIAAIWRLKGVPQWPR